jgi:beta-glucosidase
MVSIRLQLAAALLLIPGMTASAQNAPQLGKAPLKDVVAAMTTEEKAKLLVGMGWSFRPDRPPAPEDSIPEKVPGAAGRMHAIPRLGIPSLTLSDGPAGVRINPIRGGDSSKTYYATAFPSATLLASTWDTALVHSVGNAFGEEVRDYGIDILLAPAMNIHRNPLGGRNFEYYSEDPVVSGHISAAFVRGIQDEGVGTSVKHFVANNQEFNRTELNTLLSERALREIYLKGFRIAVQEGQPWTVMSSYNLINGTYTSESRGLLTTVLRDEWGFKGFVMTDWGGGKDPVAQMNAGNDVIMPGNPDQTQAIVAAVKSGKLSQQQLDENVERTLRIVLLSPTFKQYKYSNAPDLKAHAQVSRHAATQGMVLLKNDGGTLPLAQARKVALFGKTSYDLLAGGTGSGDVNKAYMVSLDQGLTNAGYALAAPLADAYARYIAEQKAEQPRRTMFRRPPPIPEMAVDPAVIRRAAGEADVAMITLGRISGEGTDRVVEGDFTITDTEHALIKHVADAFHAAGKKVVVVLNIASVTDVASWRDQVDAILLAWLPGLEGGNAIADVLSGKVDPSGKLASTFPVFYSDVPSASNFPGKELPRQGEEQAGPRPPRAVPSEVTYDEGIYVGYRYYDTFGVKPAYEFGYGLSYTTFDYSDLKLSSSRFAGSITATVTVKNSGTVPGREVAEVYVSAPGKTMDKPEEELRAFAKTTLLQPGQSQVLTFTLGGADLASYDTARSAWVAEAGTYTVKLGASSSDIRQHATFDLPQELVVEKVQNVLMPQVTIHERTPARQ